MTPRHGWQRGYQFSLLARNTTIVQLQPRTDQPAASSLSLRETDARSSCLPELVALIHGALQGQSPTGKRDPGAQTVSKRRRGGDGVSEKGGD